MNINSDLLKQIREQFDTEPYPRVPIDKTPKNDILRLYIHNLVTAYYRRNKTVIEPKDQVILDAACGTGFTTLCLAEANPGAKIIGVDISEASLVIARERLKYHGFEQVEFYNLALENLPDLAIEFDYINADEVTYLVPDAVAVLKAFQAVLAPQGIIRTNLHSSLQRFSIYQAQSIFKMMGLMDEAPSQDEVEVIREIFHSLKDSVNLKQKAWRKDLDNNDEYYMMNYLLKGDKGFTITELFELLEAANLEFISMVEWRKWQLLDLFKNPDDLPAILAFTLPELTIQEQLRLYELINPVHRLLDFWCGHSQSQDFVFTPETWTVNDWQTVKIHLHPQLKTAAMKTALFKSINNLQPFEISRFLPITEQDTLLDGSIAACLLPPLLESSQTLDFFVQRWQTLYPVNSLTLAPTTQEKAREIITQVVINQEELGYILLER